MTSENAQENSKTPTEQRQPNKGTDDSPEKVAARGAEFKPPESADKCCKSCKRKKHWLDYATFVVEILGLVGLVIYAILTYGIWCANKKSANAATEATKAATHAMRVDQRAWVGFGEIKPSSFTLKRDQPFVIAIPVHNVGKTPAKVMSAGINGGSTDRGQRQDGDSIVAPSMGPPTALLLPGESHDLKITSTFVITQDMLNDLQRTATIRIFGKATYTDIFGKDHWTRYCYNSAPYTSGEITFKACVFYTGIDSEEE